MTIVFGTETVRKFDRLEAMSNRTVGVAKLCRHGLTGKEWSRDPVPTGCFDHGVSMILTTPTCFFWRCHGRAAPPPGQDAGGDGVDSHRVVGVQGLKKLDLVATVLHPKCRCRFEVSPGEGFAGVS